MTRVYVRRRKFSEALTSEMKAHRAQIMYDTISILQDEISKNLAECPESEWVFGRLFLLGLLSQTEYDIILRFDALGERYRSFLAPTLKMKIWKPENLRSFQENLSPSALKKMEEVQKEYERACAILRCCGSGVDAVIFKMLDTNTIVDFKKMRIGIAALIEEF